MPETRDLQPVFDRLKRIMKAHAKRMTVEYDTRRVTRSMRYSEQFKRVLYFGGVQVKKNYVSYYLMPVYIFPTC